MATTNTLGRFARLGQGHASRLARHQDEVLVPQPRERPGLVDLVIGEGSITSRPAEHRAVATLDRLC